MYKSHGYSVFQFAGDGSVLASVHQQRGQRGQIQESSGLVRRLTLDAATVVWFDFILLLLFFFF